MSKLLKKLLHLIFNYFKISKQNLRSCLINLFIIIQKSLFLFHSFLKFTLNYQRKFKSFLLQLMIYFKNLIKVNLSFIKFFTFSCNDCNLQVLSLFTFTLRKAKSDEYRNLGSS